MTSTYVAAKHTFSLSSTFVSFTPSSAVDVTKEKEWAANLGMLDWDSTSIVFTKRSLIEFLKWAFPLSSLTHLTIPIRYTGTTVDTNFNNISKLPRYAKFGKLTSISETGDTQGSSKSEIAPTVPGDSTNFKPSCRVRTAPGGPTQDIFVHDEGEDALSTAPPKSTSYSQQPTVDGGEGSVVKAPVEEVADVISSNFKPSRRVRAHPGGQSSLSNFWDTEEPADGYKPTRRVREGPGGQDHMNDVL
ncbi:hypothetical protein AX15_000955 [Amanita polypyramis BW_CC]|nr:hypothetical protein AX15_000955 [Amanita polypyramis BW_CC]